MARLHKFINRVLQNRIWLVKYLKQVMTWSLRLDDENPERKPMRTGGKIFTRILDWRLEIMQRKNLMLHRPTDNIWPSRAVWHYTLFSVSAISWHSPHCRPPNNIQLFFLAFLRDIDCCKEHLAKCPSPKPSLWLSDLARVLLTFLSLIIFIHPKSIKIPIDLSHICPPTHPKYFSNFPNESGRSSAENSSIYPSLIPSRDGLPSAQSKVRVLWGGGKNASHILWFICKNNELWYKGILTILS